jgi:hypothetical protein
MGEPQAATVIDHWTPVMHPKSLHHAYPNPHHQRLLGAVLLWLLGGAALLLSTLVPMHTEWLGWTPAFWLLGAPIIVLLGLEPTLPRELLTLRRPRHHAPRLIGWH